MKRVKASGNSRPSGGQVGRRATTTGFAPTRRELLKLGAVGLPGYALYAATKGGVTALTRTLGVEWARHNVQVNAIAPGWFVTDMNERAFADPRTNERLTRDIPMRRTGRPEEIGPLAVYLASSASDFMTGQTIFLDGGHSAA